MSATVIVLTPPKDMQMITVEINRTINDPAASDLLRFICAKSLGRDPVDAVNDLEYAAELFRKRLGETQ